MEISDIEIVCTICSFVEDERSREINFVTAPAMSSDNGEPGHQSAPSGPITLDVGGVRYKTSLMTLTRYPDSMLGRMFGGDIPSTTDQDGAFFIDRDG